MVYCCSAESDLLSSAVLRFNLAFVFRMNKKHDGAVHLFELFSLGRKAGLQ